MGSDELDALIAEAREYVGGWLRTGERVPRPGDQAERIPFWNEARTALTDAENARRYDAIKQWEKLHGHDVRSGCYPEYGCMVIESYSADVILRLLDALSALRDANPEEWEYQCNLGPYSDGQYTSWIGVAAEHRCGGRLRRRRQAGPWLPVPSFREGSK